MKKFPSWNCLRCRKFSKISKDLPFSRMCYIFQKFCKIYRLWWHDLCKECPLQISEMQKVSLKILLKWTFSTKLSLMWEIFLDILWHVGRGPSKLSKIRELSTFMIFWNCIKLIIKQLIVEYSIPKR